MAFYMDVDPAQALQEARGERDAALAMAEREGRRADALAVALYDATQHLEYKTLDLAALKDQNDLNIAALNAQKDAEILMLRKQLRNVTLQVQESREEAARTLKTTLYRCEEEMARVNAVKEDAERALHLMSEAYVNLNNAFHQLASWNTALRRQLDAAAIRHHNHEHDMDDLWAERQRLRAHAEAVEEALNVMARDFAAARAYILNRIDAFTEGAILTVVFLERDLRATRALLAAQGS